MKMHSILILNLLLVSGTAFGAATIPDCQSSGQILAVNNEQVLNWEKTTRDQYHNRGHIQGTVQRIFPDKTGHHHLEVLIGSGSQDFVEVIYNEDFGSFPASLKVGSQVEACGDYITTRTSPDGAILHWVHKSDTPKHDSGYVVVDGTLCGWN